MNIIDLFSGCGGMSLGFSNAGHRILASYDNWVPAIECYELNFAHPIYKKDLSDVELITQELNNLNVATPIDLIMGGPPCQDFSNAGQRLEGDRANLTASLRKSLGLAIPTGFSILLNSLSSTSPSYN